MPHDIRPTAPDDLPGLGRFLTAGFHAPAGAAFAAPDVLRWKYLDPRGPDAGDAPRSWLALDPATGRIVGHVGVCPSRFRGPGLPSEGVSTLHMIDWLATGSGTGAGALLMRRAHQSASTQFGFGGSAAGRGVIDRGGYGLVGMVPVYQRVLRAGYRLRSPGRGLAGRAVRSAKDAAGLILRRPARAKVRAEIRPVEAFGDEVTPVLAAYAGRAVFTSRGPDLLNAFLRHPRGGLTGWQIFRDGRRRGLAVLSVVPGPDGVTSGKLAELLLDDPDDLDLWHASALALTAELAGQGADVALAFASTPWSARALRSAGYAPASPLEFRLRDRSHLIPTGVTFHLTPLEADYAYT